MRPCSRAPLAQAEAGGAASGSESDDSDDASGSGSEDVPGGQEAPPFAPKAASAVLALNLETSNPNAPKPASLKPTQVAEGAEPVELTRRERCERRRSLPLSLTHSRREAIEQQRAQARHWKLTEQGKTDEAVKDLARLTLIKAQREEAAKKRRVPSSLTLSPHCVRLLLSV